MAQKKDNQNEELTIEQSFEALEEIISKMESSDISLDDSFALYKAGMEELQNANAKIVFFDFTLQIIVLLLRK